MTDIFGRINILATMKRVKTILTITILLLAFSECLAQSAEDDMLYVYTNTSNEAVMYQLDDVSKITFGSNGVQLWSTNWPTEYPYGNFKNFSFIKSKNTYLQGDVNTDGKVDVADVMIVANNILGNMLPLYHGDYADMNNDGVVDITDVNLIIDVILSFDKVKAPSVSSHDSLSMMAMGAKTKGKVQHSEHFLNFYQDAVVIKQISIAEIDSINVTGTEPRNINMWHSGKSFLTYMTEEIDSITLTNKGGYPFSYIGIVGFNDNLYMKDIGILSKSTANEYTSFVNNVHSADGTLLYYAVDNAMDMLDNAGIETPLKNVTLVTFTDGLDQGSLMMTDKYGSSYEYLEAMKKRISSSVVGDLSVNAYSVALRGNDVSNIPLFKQNLQDLASSGENIYELSNINELRNKLRTIADQIISVSNRQTVTIRIPGVDNGTRMRFTFDGKPVESSELYIEGTFNLQDRSLRDVSYHGIKATSGKIVQGTQVGIKVDFTFTGLHLESGTGLVPTSIKHFYLLPSATSWQKNSEFDANNNTLTSVSHLGTCIFLILDCSISLGSDFSMMKQYANEFINMIAGNAEPYRSLEAPTNVKAVMDDNVFAVHVSWDARKYAQSYRVYRSNSPSGTYQMVAEDVTSNKWKDESPLEGYNYYKIDAVCYRYTSSQSFYASVNVKLDTPTNVTALMDDNKWAVNVSWDAVKYAESYSVYRSSNSRSGFTKVADSLTVTFWCDESPLNGSNYYRIYAMGHGVMSQASSTSDVAKCEMIAAPTNVTASLDDKERAVNVSWDAVKYAEYYSVYRGSGSSYYFTKVADSLTVTSWHDELPLKGSNYYRIYAMGHGLTSSVSQTSNVVNVPFCHDNYHPHLIDLGLPSGTKWACCNVDTDHPKNQSPTNYGSYYAWGETETKTTYDWSTYIHCDGSQATCHNLGSDIAGTEHDVAHVKWGGSWVMPSDEQQNELINNCTYEWTIVNGVYGGKFTSKKNGASIFLPAAGYREETALRNNSNGYYWSSTQYPSNSSSAYYLYFYSGNTYTRNKGCNYGQSVRPVAMYYPPLNLSSTSLDFKVGEEGTISVTSGSGSYSVMSGNTEVATAVIDGAAVKVTAVAVGTATITVTDTQTEQTAIIEVKVNSPSLCPDDHHPHLIDLGLPSRTKWACCNVDTDHPENQTPTNYGGYYAWGEIETKTTYECSTYAHCDGAEATCHDLGSYIAGTEYDVAHMKWGGSWVMPLKVQLAELINNCTYEWTTVNGVKGKKFTSKKNGASIFLPAAGYRGGSELYNARWCGYYWSSAQSPSFSDGAYTIFFRENAMDTCSFTRIGGLSVRPVARNDYFFVLSSTSLDLNVGDEGTISVASGSGSYSVVSGDAEVATAVIEGASVKVTAFAVGTTTIIVTDTQTEKTAIIEVTVLCPDSNHPHMIDLGLPSGTKWACCNVDTDYPKNQTPTNYGGYYAWGDTQTKSDYSESTYQYYKNGSYQSLGSDIAGTEYDVAHVKWSGSWVMPSYDQQTEFLENCTYEWTTMNGVKGGKFTSKKNGASIFLPAAGYRYDSVLRNAGTDGYYRSSTEGSSSISQRCLYFASGSPEWSYLYRSTGQSVRPVDRNYSHITLSSTSLDLYVGDEGTISVTSGSGGYSVVSGDAEVATVVIEGASVKVTAVAAGTATITVTDTQTEKTAIIEVIVTSLCPDDHHPHLIDLGLPSGTKWACCNVDTDHPENQTPTNYGGYYAWGETETKTTYDWSTYAHCDGSEETCHDFGNDIAGTEYDVAHVKWGGSWVMPSRELAVELINNCTYEWTTVNGVKGKKFTSKKNGVSIFLPAAGYRYDSGLSNADSNGNYWSSSHYPSNASCAYYLSFHSGGTYTFYNGRDYGRSVRPVVRNYSPFTLPSTSLDLNVGEESAISVTFGSGGYSVVSGDTEVATAVIKGASVKVTAVAAGTATITLTDTQSGQTATIEVTVTPLCPDDHHPHLIDLGLSSGTKWACCNVDTDYPENQTPANYGGYYAWGDTETKSDYSESAYQYYKNGSYQSLGSDIAGTEYDVAHVKWGGSWVMPSYDQQEELIENCTCKFTTMNGVKGGKFTSRTNGGSIFLPAAGYRNDSGLNYAGSHCRYWLSTEEYMGNAYYLDFYSGFSFWDYYYYRYYGQSVRPVVNK